MVLIKLIAPLIAYPFVKLAKLLKRKPKKDESKGISGIGILGRDVTFTVAGSTWASTLKAKIDFLYAEIEELKKLRESAKENNDLAGQIQLSHKIIEKLIEASKELQRMAK